MQKLEVQKNPQVETVFASYPEAVREKLQYLRQLILQVADEIEAIGYLEETLKWGEPSYLAKKGSTIRIDWKKKTPGQYAIYFKCTSRLVPTFKAVYDDLFEFEGNRAMIFKIEDKLPEEELIKCIKVALTYHRVKHLPLLGL